MKSLLAIAPAATTLLCTSCGLGAAHMLSHELNGVWMTGDPRYRGLSMELSPTFVILVTGPDEPARVQWVDKVQSDVTADGFAVTVESTDFADRNSARMCFQFSRANGGELHFPNEGRVWKWAW